MSAEQEAKLEQYESNLQKVNDLLLNNPEDENLIQLRQDLSKVIDLTKTLINEKKTSGDADGTKQDAASIPNVEFKTKEKKKRTAHKKVFSVGSRCEVEHKGLWYAAVIENIGHDTDTNQPRYTIRWILTNKEELVVGDSGLREIKRTKGELDIAKLKLGSRCMAKYSADGNWYKASILEITRFGCLVHYVEYGNREKVPFEYIAGLEEKTDDDSATTAKGTVANVPEHLRVLPTDSESVRANKKRKLKSLKRQANLAVQDHISEQRQNTWQAFKAKKQGKRTMKKKSMFAVEENNGSLAGRVGVIGSAAKMGDLVTKPKRTAWAKK